MEWDCWNGPNLHLKGSDLKVVVQKCPKLEHLNLLGRLHEDFRPADLEPLQVLSCLTYLGVGGNTGTCICLPGDEMLVAIGKLTSLKHLMVADANNATELGLAALAELTRLTKLEVVGLIPSRIRATVPPASDRRDVVLGESAYHMVRYRWVGPQMPMTYDLTVTCKSPDSLPVWQHLATCCKLSPKRLAKRFGDLERELASAKQEAADAREERNAAKRKALTVARWSLSAAVKAAAARRKTSALEKLAAALQDELDAARSEQVKSAAALKETAAELAALRQQVVELSGDGAETEKDSWWRSCTAKAQSLLAAHTNTVLSASWLLGSTLAMG